MKILPLLASTILLGAALGGCSDPQATGTVAASPGLRADLLIGACNGYAAFLDGITPMRQAGQLPADFIGAVDIANQEVDPICQSGKLSTGLTPESAATVVQQQITRLAGLLANRRAMQ